MIKKACPKKHTIVASSTDKFCYQCGSELIHEPALTCGYCGALLFGKLQMYCAKCGKATGAWL